jgi:hypothetical protein
MSRILVFDSTLITVWAYPGRRLIHHRMKSFCHGDEFRGGLNRGLEALQRYRATKWLSDDRANSVLPEDEAWAAQDWFPRAKAAGWTHWAMVPAGVLGHNRASRFVKNYLELGISARMFSDLDDAMKWLDAA